MPTPHIQTLANRYLAIEECCKSLDELSDKAYHELETEFSIWAAESGADRELDFDQQAKLEELLYGN